MNDLRFAIRQLGRSPGFTATVVLTLALGLAVNATVFLFITDLFLRPLPVHEPDRLVFVMQQSPRFRVPLQFSYLDYRDMAASVADDGRKDKLMASAFSGLAAFQQIPVSLSRSGAVTERTWMAVVSDNFFDVLGVGPALGSLFAPEKGRASAAEPSVVLTHGYWQKRFNGNPAIVGQTITINGVACTVIGVTAPGFQGPQWMNALSGFVPYAIAPQLDPAHHETLTNRGMVANLVMGRLRGDVTLEQARAAAEVMVARLIAQYPEQHAPGKAIVIPEFLARPTPFTAGVVPRVVAVLAIGALLVLAVAAANAMNLLFARALERQRELAVRSALGASRGRLVWQLVVESIPAALIAGALALLLAQWAGDALAATMGSVGDLPPAAEYGFNWRFVAGVALLSLLAGLLAALGPALKATRHAVVPMLNASGTSVTGTRQRIRQVLIVAQVALSCVVLIAAGLGLRSARALAQVNPGFDASHLLLASYDLGLQNYEASHGRPAARQFHRNLLERVRALPGVSSATLSAHVPFDIDGGGRTLQGSVTAAGAERIQDPRAPMIPVVAVDHDFLRTMRIPVRTGRDFAASDTETAPRVCIVNEAMARRLWPNQDAIGKRLIVGGRPPHEVVGVVADGRYLTLAQTAQPHVFVPLEQNFRAALTLIVRTEADPLGIAPAIQRAVRRMEPDLPLFNIRTMEQQMTHSPQGLLPVRFGAALVGFQGAMVLVLALSGMHALVSFDVARRTREIGLRMALGANSARLIRSVVSRSLVLTLIGLGLGLGLAFVVTRPLGNLLYGVAPHDAGVFSAVSVLILAIAFAACWLPARRATRVNPVEALRSE